MFTLARADAGNYPLHETPMYLDEVVNDVVRSARVLAAAKDVSVQASAIPSAAFTGDEDLIRRLLVNLIDNAVRYAPQGTTVRATIEQTAAGYCISISDNGPGIPPDVQPHIFERFYRGDAARARSQSDGAGLGLALVRWIATVHGGEVMLARSSAAGTTFTVQLPASPPS
jgi:signal transduction histidine kinase